MLTLYCQKRKKKPSDSLLSVCANFTLLFLKGDLIFLSQGKENKCSSYCLIALVCQLWQRSDWSSCSPFLLNWLVHLCPSVLSCVVQISDPLKTPLWIVTEQQYDYLNAWSHPIWGVSIQCAHCSSLPKVIVNQKVKGAKQTSRPGSVHTCNYLPSMYIVWFTIPTTECGCIIKSSKSLCRIGVKWVLLSYYLWYKNEIFCVCARQCKISNGYIVPFVIFDHWQP